MLKFLVLFVALAAYGSQPSFAASEQILKEVHDAEAKFENDSDDKAAIDWDGFRKVGEQQKKLLVLDQDGHKVLASYVYKASALRNGFDLSEFVADDTIHTTEFEYTPIVCKPGETFKFEIAWPETELSRCDFYLGNPGKMHDDGYKSVVKIVRKGDTITLPAKMSERDELLFAIVKPKAAHFYKFVFVLRAHPSKRAS